MKLVRTALIILVGLLLSISIGNYINKHNFNNERQELLEKYENDIAEKTDLLKDDLSQKNYIGDNNISPINSSADKSQNDQSKKLQEKGYSKKDYKVIGRIKINKIKVDYPIIDETTEETLDISITKFVGDKINLPGNLVLAGHNMKDGSLFGRLKELIQGDTIELYDQKGVVRQYKVYKIYIVEPTDLTPLDQETEGKCIVTLLTCTNHGEQRLILKCK